MKAYVKAASSLALTILSLVVYAQSQPPTITEIYPNPLYQGTEAILIIKGNSFGDLPVVKAEALQQEFPGTVLLNLKEKVVVRFEYIPEAQLFIRVTNQSGDALAVLPREYVTAEKFTKEIVQMMGMISENADARMKDIVATTKQAMLTAQDEDTLETTYEGGKEAIAALEEETKDTLTSIRSFAHDKLKTFPEDVSVWSDILHTDCQLYIRLAVIGKIVCFDILKIWFGFQDANLQNQPCQDIRKKIAEIKEETSELLRKVGEINEYLRDAKKHKKDFEEAAAENKLTYAQQIATLCSSINASAGSFKEEIDDPATTTDDLVGKASDLKSSIEDLLKQKPKPKEHLKILRNEIKEAEKATSDAHEKASKKYDEIESFEDKLESNSATPELDVNAVTALNKAAASLDAAADAIRDGTTTLNAQVDDVLEDLRRKLRKALKDP